MTRAARASSIGRPSPAVEIAARGIEHASSALPHAERIQASFGAHDIRGVRAAIGGVGGAAAEQIGANAYTIADRVAFRSSPDLRLAGHEAAHVIQQRAGIELAHGVGRRNDTHERAAEAIADAVVAGRSAEAILDALPRHDLKAGVQRDPLPTVEVAHGYDEDGVDQIVVVTTLRGDGILLDLDADPDTGIVLTSQPGMLQTLGSAIVTLLHPNGEPVPETPVFLMSARVTTLLEQELPAWVVDPSIGFPKLTALLAKRAEIMRGQRVRAQLEEYLGVDPGTVDWISMLPQIRDDVFVMGETLRQRALADRVTMMLLILEREVASGPQVVGGVAPPELSQACWDFGSTFFLTGEGANSEFGEKFLGEYVKMLADLEFVPTDFDLAKHKPRGADIAESKRHEILDLWIDWAGPQLTTKVVLDDWTTSGLDFQVFLDTLDLDAQKDRILDVLADEYMKEARKDPDMMRAIRHMADEEARFQILTRLVLRAKLTETYNDELIAKIDDPDPDNYPELVPLIADPRTYYEGSFYYAQAMRTILNGVTAGGRVDRGLITQATQIAGKANIPNLLGLGFFLVTLGEHLRELEETAAEQRAKARKEIAARVDLSWDRIKQIIADRGWEAEVFIDNTWVPMLKEVATEWVEANYAPIKHFYDNFDAELPQVIGRYRIAAWLIEDVANRLESGEIEQSTLAGHTVTLDNLEELRDAAKVMNAKANDLESPLGQYRTYSDLDKAVDAYGRVKQNIENGKYSPHNYGDAVVVEAKRRLGIGVFEYASLWDQATRRVTVRENPFQAYAIAMWRVEHIIDTAVSNLLSGFLTGLLTIGSLIVPGVGGLILAAIDIGIGLRRGLAHIDEAERRLDLARLDTELTIQGITVEEAEHALDVAWVTFVIECVLAGVFTALGGILAFKGLKKLRFPNLAKLIEKDPALAAQLLARLGKDAKLLDKLLGKFADDAAKLVEALAYASDGKKLLGLLDEVKDAEKLVSLLVGAGSDAELVKLMAKFKDLDKLDHMLGVARPEVLLRLHDLVQTEKNVALLLAKMDAAKALKFAEAGVEVEHAIKVADMGEDALRGLARIADTNAAAAAATAKAFSGSNVSGDVGKLLADVATADDALVTAKRTLAEARTAGTATIADETAVASAQAAFDQAALRVERTRQIASGESTFGAGVKVEIRVGADGKPVLSMPSVPLHRPPGTTVDMHIPIDPIEPVNGHVNAGGGNETPDASNLNPIHPYAGGPPGTAIQNHIKAGIEQMDMVFKPGSVHELSSSKIRYNDIDWERASRSAYKSMAPGGTFQLNVWTGTQADVDALIAVFEKAGFRNVKNQFSYRGTVMPGVGVGPGTGTYIQGVK